MAQQDAGYMQRLVQSLRGDTGGEVPLNAMAQAAPSAAPVEGAKPGIHQINVMYQDYRRRGGEIYPIEAWVAAGMPEPKNPI